jgi:hypothetical protein
VDLPSGRVPEIVSIVVMTDDRMLSAGVTAPKVRRFTVHVDAAPHVAHVNRVWHRLHFPHRPLPRVGSTADFDAAGAQNNTRGFSTLQTLLSGVAGCGRSALLVRMDLDVRTVRIECHFDDVARGLCLWWGPRAGGSFA